jgi:hypothetical protein
MLFADATKCNCREISAWGSRNVREIKFVKLKTLGALKFSLCHVFIVFLLETATCADLNSKLALGQL